MNKNGKFRFSLVGRQQLISGLWDPHAYQHYGDVCVLANYIVIRRVGSDLAPKSSTVAACPFLPLEYKDVPGGNYLSFALTPACGRVTRSVPSVREEHLLFGTMRAYLGNIVVTPQAEWIGLKSPLAFSTKSEFVSLLPHDNLPYFWLIYLRSHSFLEHLPLGSGGTRPRLQPQTLENIPVSVPDLEIRRTINEQVRHLAAQEWRTYFAVARTVTTLVEKL